jgi:methylmalonyl-CoA mutase
MKLFEEFPPVATAEWEEAIRRDLKGADYEKKLIWKTEEGIDVRPYYRQEDLAGLEYLRDAPPAAYPYLRGARADRNVWAIRQEIAAASCAEANRLARESVRAGAGEVAFAATPASRAELETLLAGLPLETTAVHFQSGARTPLLLALLAESQLPVRGSADFDPLGELARTGSSGLEREALFDEATACARQAPAGFRPLAVHAGLVAEAGGTAVQELGVGLAHAAEYLAEITARGLTVDQAAAALTLHFAVGANYFFEIAKLRAARLLYAQMVSAFGPAGEQACRAVVACSTMRWDKTVYDPYVNVLRATTQAMAAVIGGCDSLAVTPFNAIYQAPDEFSGRLARNTQIILRDEAYLDRHVDPAAGSYLFEVLTDAIAREAWGVFQQVEAAGGYLAALEAGWIQQEVGRAAEAKRAAVAARRRVLVGTNQYPNPGERMLGQIQRPLESPPPSPAAAPLRVAPLAPWRAATPFEQLRLRTERHAAAGGKTPCFFLLEIGDPKMRKARSGFVANFLGCAGFQTVESGPVESVDAALAAAQAAAADAIVLCSSDPEYPALAAQVCPATTLPVLVAGFPKDSVDQLRASGVADFIHLRSNPLEALAGWQERLGVRA